MNLNKQFKSTHLLPASYEVYQLKDLKNDKKIALMIQVIFLIIAGFMVFVAFYFDLPIKNELTLIPKLMITLLFVVIYMLIHELTHGLFIRIISKQKPTYGFHFPYLITGSNHYYNKLHFMMILLAPVCVWGIVLVILLFVAPQTLFMSLYIITGLNFAGSSGDYVQAFMIKRLPEDVLIKDDGKSTTYYINSRNEV